MGTQVTVEGGEQLSCSLDPVAKEDSGTYLNVAMNVLQEIAEVGSDDEGTREQLMRKILGNLTATMTDRAASMKKFGQILQEKKREILQTDEELDFLFCNAHCLLGFADICEKKLKHYEAERGWAKRLGQEAGAGS